MLQVSPLRYVSVLKEGWDWVLLVRQPLFGLSYQPQMDDDDEWLAGEPEVLAENLY
jgi:hypothetical protein